MSEGYEGSYQVLKVSEGTLKECRDLAGPPSVEGKHWVMVDLNTGQFKWYQKSKKRWSGGGGKGKTYHKGGYW